MTSIDPIINQMRESGCNSCECGLAIFDETQEQVRINGSFCSPTPGSMMIEITAFNIETRKEIWTETCDTGRLCAIPFVLEEDWICYNSNEDTHDIVFLDDHWEIFSALGHRGHRAVFNENQYILLIEVCELIDQAVNKYNAKSKDDFNALLQFAFIPDYITDNGFVIEYNNDTNPFEEHLAIYINPQIAQLLKYVMSQARNLPGVVMDIGLDL